MSEESVYYVVRGAKMRCDKGSHTRKINLPVSHGSYVKEKPVMNEGDRVVDENISYFGICKECSDGEEVYLIDEKSGGTIIGKKCKPQILTDWSDSKEDTLVEGRPALTTKSWITCAAHNGIIKFESDGQEEK